jgi:dephospho-CoA kinase
MKKVKRTGPVKVVGLTGGIATGKTTVARELRRHGAKVIEADRLSREILMPGSTAWKKVIAAFGEGIRKKDNSIDRQKLAGIVFASRVKRRVLERITHPAIFKRLREKLAAVKRSKGPVVIDAPLLFETGLDREVDRTVVVWAPYAVQLERLCRRDGLEQNEAVRRIAAQWPLEKKKKLADHVIDNSVSPGGVKRQVNKLWGDLTNNQKLV